MKERESNSQSFWTTAPGATVLAALIGALSAVFLAWYNKPPVTSPPTGAAPAPDHPKPVDDPNPSDVVLIDTWNTDDVASGPTRAAQFSITAPHRVTNIRSYHWNNGNGSPRGNIGLRRDDGTMFGPWEVTTSAGSEGRQNLGWECSPNATIPAGTYTVVDSDPDTWSYNPKSGSRGMTIVKGRKLSSQ